MKIDDYPFNQLSLTWIIIEDTDDKNPYGWWMMNMADITILNFLSW